jgi:hypothetical protein
MHTLPLCRFRTRTQLPFVSKGILSVLGATDQRTGPCGREQVHCWVPVVLPFLSVGTNAYNALQVIASPMGGGDRLRHGTPRCPGPHITDTGLNTRGIPQHQQSIVGPVEVLYGAAGFQLAHPWAVEPPAWATPDLQDSRSTRPCDGHLLRCAPPSRCSTPSWSSLQRCSSEHQLVRATSILITRFLRHLPVAAEAHDLTFGDLNHLISAVASTSPRLYAPVCCIGSDLHQPVHECSILDNAGFMTRLPYAE